MWLKIRSSNPWQEDPYKAFFAYNGETDFRTTMAILAQYVELYPLLRQYKDKKRAMAISTDSMSTPFFFCNKESGLNLGIVQTIAIWYRCM
jgi:hypothetical protein